MENKLITWFSKPRETHTLIRTLYPDGTEKNIRRVKQHTNERYTFVGEITKNDNGSVHINVGASIPNKHETFSKKIGKQIATHRAINKPLFGICISNDEIADNIESLDTFIEQCFIKSCMERMKEVKSFYKRKK